jgi:branched-chain amino acid transport system substrate-binding protein
MNLRRTWWLAGAALFGLLAAGCGGGSQSAEGGKEGGGASGDEILIGLVASQNGDLKPWGDDSIAGAQLAVDEANEAGGIDGRKLRLVIQDSNSEATQGKSAAEKLASDNVVVMLGEVASSITEVMADVAVEKGIPLIAVGATKTTITEKGENIFRVCYTDDLQGPVMAKFAYDDLGLRKVAIVTDNKQAYSKYLSQTFSEHFKKLGGEIVGEEFYETGAVNFAGQATNLAQTSPEGVFLSGYFNEVGPLAKAIRAAGMKNAKLLGGDGWDSLNILQSGGDAIIGGYFCNHYNSAEDRPEVLKFLEAFKAKNGKEPGTTMGALGYDAAALAIDAIRRAADEGKPIDRESVTAAIASTEGFAGVSGSITLKGMGGNPPKRALIVELTKEGQMPAKSYEASEVLGS